MKILVQKFGGTSVSTHDRRKMVVDKILKAKQNGYSPIVVVSAMGRQGEPYATDTLLSLVSNNLKENNHEAIDLLMSCGETISSVVMSDELEAFGIKAVPLMGGQAGIITDNKFNDATVIDMKTDKLLGLLKKGAVPVVTGFQGVTKDGYVTTLGRGGSDVTAAVIGAYLNVQEVEIYTDVDGIMTADPRIVSEATLIEKMSYNEVFQFADQGAKVIHPKAVEIAMKANIPLSIKNTLNSCSGTLINNEGWENSNNLITGITCLDNRVQVQLNLEENKENGNYYNILDILAKNLISIDFINVFPDKNIFTIDGNKLGIFKNLMSAYGLNYTYIDNCSKISVIGSRIRGIPGVMAKILKALSDNDVSVLQTADSHTTIWCLVETKHTKIAINALHRVFNLG